LQPHSRVTGNFAASSRSPKFPKKEPVSLIESLNKIGRQAQKSMPLLRRICASRMRIFQFLYLTRFDIMWLFFCIFLETKNEAERKLTLFWTFRRLWPRPFWHISKEDFQRSFLKLYDHYKHCISSKEMYFE